MEIEMKLEMHGKYPIKYFIGSVLETNKSGRVVITNIINSKRCEVKFLNTGFIKECTKKKLFEKKVKDTSLYPKVGDRFESKYGWLTITRYGGALDVDVVFDSGYKTHTQLDNIRRGTVLDKTNRPPHNYSADKYVYPKVPRRVKILNDRMSTLGSVIEFGGVDIIVHEYIQEEDRYILLLPNGYKYNISYYQLTKRAFSTYAIQRDEFIGKAISEGFKSPKIDYNDGILKIYLDGHGYTGWYSYDQYKSGFKPEYFRNLGTHYLYYCKFSKDGKSLYKVGISKDVERRWNSKYKGWDVELRVIDSGNHNDMFDKEQSIIEEWKSFRDTHHEDFHNNGATEMFYIDILNLFRTKA